MARLIIICGPAGAGKSTYGKKLAAELPACFLDSDTVTEPVVRAGMRLGGEDPDDRDSKVYRRAFREAVYECLYQTASENLPHLPVVMVGPFTSEIQDPEWPNQLSERLTCEVEVRFVSCDEKERYCRIQLRSNPRDALKIKDWDAYIEGSSIAPPVFPYVSVSS